MPLFPKDILPSPPYVKRVRYATLKAINTAGDVVQRRRKRTTPLYEVSLIYRPYITEADINTLWEFYRARYGDWEKFNFFDFETTTWVGEPVGTGDAVEDTFNSGAKNVTSETVKVDGVTQTEGSGNDYQMSVGTGTDGQDEIVFESGSIPASGGVITIGFTGQKYFSNIIFRDSIMSREQFQFTIFRTGLELIQVTT